MWRKQGKFNFSEDIADFPAPGQSSMGYSDYMHSVLTTTNCKETITKNVYFKYWSYIQN